MKFSFLYKYTVCLLLATIVTVAQSQGWNGGSDNDDGDLVGEVGAGGYSSHPPGAHCGASLVGCSAPAKFVAPLPLLSVIDGTNGGHVTIVSSKSCQQVFHTSSGDACGSATEVWAYNGTWPGPTVLVAKGTPFDITHKNDLGQDYEGNNISISVHHHGAHARAAFDGHPQAQVVSDLSFAIDGKGNLDPGQEFTYETVNSQEPGTLWYHDHQMHDTGRNVIMGMAGFFLLQAPNDQNVSLYDTVRDLPSGEYHVGLAIQDRLFTASNQFDYPMNHDELLASRLVREGYFGDTMIVNGVHAPYFDVKRGWYRFRLLNGCNARQLRLEIQTSSGTVQDDIMYQIGTEGGYIAAPRLRSSIYMAPGERYDIMVDFSRFEVGTTLYFRNTFDRIRPSLPDVMEFRIGTGSTPPFSLPSTLISYLFPSEVAVTRTMPLVKPQEAWTIGGIMYDPNVANLQVRQGDTERWIFDASRSRQPHPMHIHLVQFHIDDATPGGLEDGWKDMIILPDSGQRAITATFGGEPGIYMLHCHNLEHEDWDMMLQFEICDDSSEHPCDAALLRAFAEADNDRINARSGSGGGTKGYYRGIQISATLLLLEILCTMIV